MLWCTAVSCPAAAFYITRITAHSIFSGVLLYTAVPCAAAVFHIARMYNNNGRQVFCCIIAVQCPVLVLLCFASRVQQGTQELFFYCIQQCTAVPCAAAALHTPRIIIHTVAQREH